MHACREGTEDEKSVHRGVMHEEAFHMNEHYKPPGGALAKPLAASARCWALEQPGLDHWGASNSQQSLACCLCVRPGARELGPFAAWHPAWHVDADSHQCILFIAPTKAVASCRQGPAVLISATISNPPDTALRARDGVRMCGILWWSMRCQAEPPWHA